MQCPWCLGFNDADDEICYACQEESEQRMRESMNEMVDDEGNNL